MHPPEHRGVPAAQRLGEPGGERHRRAGQLEQRQRPAADPPVVGRVQDGCLLLDPRTIADDELELVACALRP